MSFQAIYIYASQASTVQHLSGKTWNNVILKHILREKEEHIIMCETSSSEV